MSSEEIMSISSIAIALLSAVATFLITYFKTRTASISKKVDTVINDVSNKNMKKYYIVIDNKRYYLSDLVIYKANGGEENEKTLED